ncbi:hypothetical protein Y032_0656g1209 [Ancylostoma ceylanicum]|uniref:Uncharacterized protein n=1 Tax=Ancylostoma ceylanicum TaxID=53326 RepID=A0A016WK69_9BILA|nr:hypothetical protein Y032_0656g1209 [Ancylostoma ceylanicum]
MTLSGRKTSEFGILECSETADSTSFHETLCLTGGKLIESGRRHAEVLVTEQNADHFRSSCCAAFKGSTGGNSCIGEFPEFRDFWGR